MEHTQEYDAYMRSEQWQQKRAERLKIAGYCCEMCNRPEANTKNGLQIHHITYKNLGNEDVFTDLIALCPSCHRKIHAYYSRVRSPNSI
jgi:5-methylcytosine-specific restriction endonuclease McrA